MHPDWKSFLARTGAIVDGEQVTHFGNAAGELRAAVGGNVLCELSHQGLIRASGPDTESFLQGQLTNDLRKLTPAHSQLDGFCNPKGRMLACLRVFHRGEDYYLRLPRERLTPVLKRLSMYILRAKTTLEDASDTLAQAALAGFGAHALLSDALGGAPDTVDGVLEIEGITAIRVPGMKPRFELYGEPAALQELWPRLAQKATPAGAESWRLLEILAGLPNVYDTTAEAFVPQMINLQLVNGVSFRKGCYTGQEIVARTHYLGKLKRRMYRARVNSERCPTPGEELYSPDTGPSQSAGQIVDACRHPEGGCVVLASMLIDLAENGTVALESAEGPRLALETLPYGLEMDSAGR